MFWNNDMPPNLGLKDLPLVASSSLGRGLLTGLVAYWKLDETASPSLDSVTGNGSLNGDWVGTPSSAVGKFGDEEWLQAQ